MNKKKIKAFTILELVVTMLITSIIIGVVYTSYFILNKTYTTYQAKNEKIDSIVQLNNLLKSDFAGSAKVLKSPTGIICFLQNKTVIYTITPDYIVRASSVSDTFKIASSNIATLFENKPVITTDNPQSYIDELDVTFKVLNEIIQYHYFKIYSSEELINK